MTKMSIEELLKMNISSEMLEEIPNTVITLESISDMDVDQVTKDTVTHLHGCFILEGKYPKVDKLYKKYPDLHNLGEPEKFWRKVNDILEQRNLPVYQINFKRHRTLDPKFVAACGVLSDVSDKKSMKLKLQSVGLTTGQWNNLLKIKIHREYWDQVVNNIMDYEVYQEGRMALARNVVAGDLPSIKYMNELTGKFSEKKDFDPRIIMHIMQQMLDIVTKHVTPEAARAVANELELVAIESLGIGSG